MGPFELMDLVGIDINLAAAMGIFERARSAADPLAERFRPSPIQERLVAAGRLGRKTGEGFYRYGPDGQAIGPASGLASRPAASPTTTEPTAPPLEPASSPATAIAERITLAIVNEAYRALGEGVATVADIDLALRLGAGPPGRAVRTSRGARRPGGASSTALRRYALDGPRFEPAPALVAAR